MFTHFTSKIITPNSAAHAAIGSLSECLNSIDERLAIFAISVEDRIDLLDVPPYQREFCFDWVGGHFFRLVN